MTLQASTFEPEPETETQSPAALWGAVVAMSLSAFVLVASEFLPVSLLTPIAADLGTSEGQMGQAISVSGLFAVLTSLLISSVIGRLDRKTVLLALTALMLVSSLVIAFVPVYSALMVGRAMLGVAIGGCWSMSTATAMRLVPKASVPKALAIINGGSAFAATVAAPLGSFLGGFIGWRGTFFCVIPVTVIVFLWQALTLPPMRGEVRSGKANVLGLLRRPQTAFGMLAILFLFMGQFSLFTYLRPFLETATRADVPTLSVILLTIGVTGLAGTMLIGPVLTRSLHGFLIATPLLMAALAALLIGFGASVVTTALLLAAWGLISTPAPVGWGTWLSRTLPKDAETGGGLMVATIQLGITLGATAGGILFDASGYQATFGLSVAILLLSAVFAFLTSRYSYRIASDGPLRA